MSTNYFFSLLIFVCIFLKESYIIFSRQGAKSYHENIDEKFCHHSVDRDDFNWIISYSHSG